MKKYRKICFVAAVATLIAGCALPTTIEKASAAESQYVVEYTGAGITLPLLHLDKGQFYQVEVFAFSDTNYENPLKKEDAYTFVAPEMGKFLLRYLINDNGIERYEYATLTVTDNTKPVITFNHRSTYKTGETLVLVPNITDNTASMAKVEYQLVVDGKIATSQIKGNSLTFTQAGSYKLQITVTDGGGNVTKELYSFTVGEAGVVETPNSSSQEEHRQDDGGCGSTIGVGATLVFGLLSVATIVRKGKEE